MSIKKLHPPFPQELPRYNHYFHRGEDLQTLLLYYIEPVTEKIH